MQIFLLTFRNGDSLDTIKNITKLIKVTHTIMIQLADGATLSNLIK